VQKCSTEIIDMNIHDDRMSRRHDDIKRDLYPRRLKPICNKCAILHTFQIVYLQFGMV